MPAPVGPGGDCEEGWKYAAGSCYKIFNSLISWDSARDTCLNMGLDAHLAMLETRQEYERIAHTWCK